MTQLTPAGRRFWVDRSMLEYGRDGLPSPRFTVAETAKIFFGMSGSWLRARMHRDAEHPDTWLVLDGKPIVFQRKTPSDEQSHRVFSLADIEPMAWSLHGFELDDIDRARSALRDRQTTELNAMRAAHDAEWKVERNKTPRMREQLTERHPRQLAALAEKHAAQEASLSTRAETAARRLGATLALVRAMAVLHGILPAGDLPWEALAA